MVSLTPQRLVSLLNEDSSYNIPPLLAPPQAELLRHPTLLPGERILLQQDATCVDTFTSLVKGVLHLTTFRVIFSGAVVQNIDDNSNCDDDPTEVARKGYIHQTQLKRSLTKKGASTMDRFKQKAQNLQESWASSKPSLMLRTSGRSQSRDLLCPTSEEGEQQPSSSNGSSKVYNGKSCTLLSVQAITQKKQITRKESVSSDVIVSIPCTSIYDVRKLPKNSLAKGAKLVLLADGIELLCSTLQTYKFCLALSAAYDADKLTNIFSKYTKNLSPLKWFAVAYKDALMVPKSCNELLYSRNSENFYLFKHEFQRVGLLELDCWKTLFSKQPFYPRAPVNTLIPFGITEAELFDVTKFHGGKSYPVICWRNQLEGTIMLRSGAALYRRGMFESRCEADEKYLASICYQNKHASGNKLVVFTEQNRNTAAALLATSQQISGQVTPKQGQAFCYPHVKFVYTDKEAIPDHKTVKQSSYKLQTLLSSNSDDKSFYTALGDTQWLSQISELLETASLIITALSTDKSSVLISYEDGCDRTAQLSSLSQLLLDPYYRTIDGFQVLIQKEWLSFGHMFAERCISQKSTEGHGPIFLQWLDCVWQLTMQFPLSFEFNEQFLQVIAEHAYSCRFGTFLCNSERQHEDEEIDNKTISLWTFINLTIMAETDRFKNSNFRKGKMERVLMPRFHIPSLKIWESFYAKTRFEENLQEAAQLAKDQSNLVEDMYAGLLNKYIGLVNKSKTNTRDSDQSSESSADQQRDISSLISSDAKPEIISDVFDSHDSVQPEKSDSLKATKTSVIYNSGGVRTLESKSLDNLLQKRRPETQSKTKRRIGSRKCYVNQPKTKDVFVNALAELNEIKLTEPRNHVQKKSQTFDDLCDYLKDKGYSWGSEPEINVKSLICTGFLSKLGFVRKNWLKRWFKLDLRKNCLAYFEKIEDEVPKGVIECGIISNVFADERPEKSHKHKFYVQTPKRTFEFKAPNLNLMKIWMEVLCLPSGTINVR